MAAVIASISLGLAVLLDIAATVVIVGSTVSTPLQKAFQLAFTWAVPFVGSIIVIAVLKETICQPESSP
jgi:galactitol-specific phosphotransferase system IIC component